MATTAPSWTPLINWIEGSSTSASKIGKVAGRGIEEDELDARRLELLYEQRAAGALHLAHRGCGRRCRKRLRHRFHGDRAHPERGQARS